MKLCISFALLFFASACATSQRPVTFKTTRSVPQSVSAAAAELASHGLQATHIDAEAGLIQTGWRDTKVADGQIAGGPATYVQRYAIRIERDARWRRVKVSHETRRCMVGVDVIEGSRACEDTNVRLSGEQKELEALSKVIERAINRKSPNNAQLVLTAGR